MYCLSRSKWGDEWEAKGIMPTNGSSCALYAISTLVFCRVSKHHALRSMVYRYQMIMFDMPAA